MSKEKKRPSKKAKAAQKAVAASKLLADKTAREVQSGEEFKLSNVTPRTTAANKLRPEKKRG